MKKILLTTLFILTNLQSAQVSKKKPIYFATIMANNIDSLREQIEQGCDINERFSTGPYPGETPLTLAAYYKNTEMVKLLISHKANVNVTDSKGHSPIMQAILWDDKEIAELLIEQKAQLNLPETGGDHDAIRTIFSFPSDFEKLKLLFKAGAIYNLFNTSNESFLSKINEDIYSIESASKIRYIIKSFNSLENQFIDDIMQATQKGDKDNVIMLLRSFPTLVDKSNKFEETVLLQAILFEHFELIKKLFENPLIKQKPNLLIDQDKHGNFGPNNPVEYAIKLGNPLQDPKRQKWRDIARYLINRRNEQEKNKNETILI